jgi:TPR repeat protein
MLISILLFFTAIGMPVIRSRANKGDPRALFFVASCYALGVGGIARDVAKSLPFYARCAAQGHALAQVHTLHYSIALELHDEMITKSNATI